MRPIQISALFLLTGALFSCSHLDDLGEPPAAPSPAGGAKSTDAERPEKDESVAKKDAGMQKADAGKTTCTTDDDCISDETSDLGCCDKPTKICFFITEDEDDQGGGCPAPKPTTPKQPAYN